MMEVEVLLTFDEDQTEESLDKTLDMFTKLMRIKNRNPDTYNQIESSIGNVYNRLEAYQKPLQA